MDKEPEAQKSQEKDGFDAKKTSKNKHSAHKIDQADGEIGGPSGLEPTRYGDWERKGIVSDF